MFFFFYVIQTLGRSYEKAEELFLTELHSKGSLATAVSAAALSAVDALSNAARTITDPLGRLKDFAAVTARDAADSARDVLGMQPRVSMANRFYSLSASPVVSRDFARNILDFSSRALLCVVIIIIQYKYVLCCCCECCWLLLLLLLLWVFFAVANFLFR